jgi:hypothetical protein
LYIEDKNKESKFNKNNKIELQDIALLYIQEKDNNNFVYAFFIIVINKEENDE